MISKFKASLVYKLSSRTARLHRETLSWKRKEGGRGKEEKRQTDIPISTDVFKVLRFKEMDELSQT